MNLPGDEMSVAGLLSGGSTGGCWAVTGIAKEINTQARARNLSWDIIGALIRSIYYLLQGTTRKQNHGKQEDYFYSWSLCLMIHSHCALQDHRALMLLVLTLVIN